MLYRFRQSRLGLGAGLGGQHAGVRIEVSTAQLDGVVVAGRSGAVVTLFAHARSSLASARRQAAVVDVQAVVAVVAEVDTVATCGRTGAEAGGDQQNEAVALVLLGGVKLVH